MPTHAENRPRSLDVQRAQAEERRQRLEEQTHRLLVQNYELEHRKHRLERTRTLIDVLKHLATLLGLLLLVLAYFSERLIPVLVETNIPYVDMPLLYIVVAGLYLTLVLSLVMLVGAAKHPEAESNDPLTKFLLDIIYISLIASMAVLVLSLVAARFVP